MGKAKSEKQKSRERSSAKELLILEAVRLYEVTNAAATRPEETIGYRTAALEVEKAARNKTRGPVPHINFRTVINRHKNCHRSQTESSFEDGAHMTRDQECVLCTYALEIANRGFPLNARCVEECANAILGANDASFPGVSVGTSWAKRFLQRHHEALGTYWSRNLENVWGQAVNPINIKMFYDILGIQYEKCDFKPWNIYGGDESGLMSGIAQKEKVIGGKGKKVQHQKRQTNRENTTVITTICADGTYLLPIVIFKGKHYQVRWGGQENPLSASVGYSEKGWTDGEIGLEWVKDFDRRTKDKAQGEWRLLLVDGHNSHYTLELLEYAINNNIVILCYPAHTTHVLQGLDVAVFGSFKVFWQQETLSFEMTTGQKVAKDNFLGPLLVGRAWVNAFTEDTIRAAFSKTGIYPFNRDAISDDQMAPSKETSILAHLPVAVSTPVRKLAEGVAVTRVLSSPGSSPKQLINVFYTPTKTRSLPIDPALLAQAELQRGIQQQPELSFLTSSSPILSSRALPPISFPTCSPPSPNIETLLNQTPETSQAATLQRALRESREREIKALKTLTTERTRLVLADLHLGRVKKQLYYKEEKKNKAKKAKLMGDGLPQVLTSDEFVRMERAEVDKTARAAERETAKRLQAVWKVEQAKIDEANKVIVQEFEEALRRWEVEASQAKAERRRAGWIKPKKPSKIPSLPKTWTKAARQRALQDAADAGESSSSDDSDGEGGGG